MEKLICSKLHEIEKENNVKILLAVLENYGRIFFYKEKPVSLYKYGRGKLS